MPSSAKTNSLDLIPTYEGAEPYVFVCYAREDARLIQPDLHMLQREGLHIWYDAGIPAGSDWSDVIATKIEGCASFLFFATEKSVASTFCRQEISFAVDHGGAILSVHVAPLVLPPGLRLTLGNRQSLLRYQLDPASYQQQLLKALKRSAHDTADHRAPRRDQVVYNKPDRAAVAVMPFKNLTADPQQDFLSEGISEDILNRLSSHQDLIVKARTSSFALAARNADIRTIAHTLGVTHVLEGSVQKSRNNVRITAHLIETEDERQIWSSQFTRQLDDIFLLQDEIGTEVLHALNLHLSPTQKSEVSKRDPAAYDAYLRGRFHANRMEIEPAFEALGKAVELDPDYADAQAALANMHFGFRMGPMEQKQMLVRDCLTRALSVDPEHLLATELQASARFMFDLEYQAAIDTLATVWQRHPDRATDNYATILRSIGRFEEALALSERILDRDPLSPYAHRNHAMYLRDLGRYELTSKAIDQAEQLGLKLTNERATLALEQQDIDGLAHWTQHIADDLGETHVLYVGHKAGLCYLRGDIDSIRNELDRLRDTHDALLPAFFKWILALMTGDEPLALDFFKRSLDNREHLAFTWSQGSAGMKRLFPSYYASDARQSLLRDYGLDEASINRLRVPTI